MTKLFLTHSLRQIERSQQHLDLMKRAAESCIQWIHKHYPNAKHILILAGPGNNGGDAWVIAQGLQASHAISVIRCTASIPQSPLARQAYHDFIKNQGQVLGHWQSDDWDLIIDGLFGIGLLHAPQSPYDALIDQVNRYSIEKKCPVLALDCPSGLNVDTGTAYTPCVLAAHTISFIGAKPGLYTNDGPDYCGEVAITNLALETDELSPSDGLLLDPLIIQSTLHTRKQNSHKGSHGNVGILGGAPSMIGAVLLAGRSAIKTGAGRVYLGVLASDAPSIDLNYPELMCRTTDEIIKQADHTILACGPGLGTCEQATQLLSHAIHRATQLVLDADALNVLAFTPKLQPSLTTGNKQIIITPHPTEAARLLTTTTQAIQNSRIDAALELAKMYQAITVLKGCGTVIATHTGQWWINPTGNPGLATAGTGDVLTGLVASLWAQGHSALNSALLGCYLHGLAADYLVAQGIGPIGLCASELPNAIRYTLNHFETALSELN